MDLRDASERVLVLHAIAVGVRLDDVAALEKSANMLGNRQMAGVPTNFTDAGIKGASGSLQGQNSWPKCAFYRFDVNM